ncbi:hypothetical protein CR513_54040, partial [Mucuna pruriens]
MPMEKFGAQYVKSRPHHLTPVKLLNLRKEEDESLLSFMERFSTIAMKIRDLNPEVVHHSMIMALKPGPFSNSLNARAESLGLNARVESLGLQLHPNRGNGRITRWHQG